MDVGAGAAPWSIALARENPESQVTALDLPAVLVSTRRAVSAAGLVGQFTFLPANVFHDPLPECSYDLIVLGQFCHLFDAATCADLISRLSQLLNPGGQLAIMDGVPGRPGAAVYELSLYLRTKEGALHPLAEYERWLRDAGLTTKTPVDINAEPAIMLITGDNQNTPTGGNPHRTR
ncbi:methyltransferase [Fodinicola feengrottensis]|uniref:methyltransferase n=1 Tax=Fodinicola feengrottensis TaxID=435914 RepID=UPI0013D61E39|nr:class I SAM-dependent methyltransferase [Fodinicola feengrottensis]